MALPSLIGVYVLCALVAFLGWVAIKAAVLFVGYRFVYRPRMLAEAKRLYEKHGIEVARAYAKHEAITFDEFLHRRDWRGHI